ncbi:MAG: adenylate/guanylate cyclase domain-containing protein [Casimicrobiaceae bacterium]
MAREQRRLTAIISTDVVGFSRLMELDESGTLASLKGHLRALIDPKIAEYGGRTVKSMGDGLLLEFPSVVDAVRCAVDVQRGMAERNADVSAEKQIQFRIGINVGDIIIDGEDIFGDGVNVAARLQTLAEPGGICVSRGVRDQVLDKLSFTFDELGAQQVKNIARLVDVYRIDLAGTPQSLNPGRKLWQRMARGSRGRWLAVAVVATGLGVIGGRWLLPVFNPVSAQRPPTYSIAILPFSSTTTDPSEQQLANTLTADLTSSFTRSAQWSVVSPSVAATYRGKAVDARVAGHDLNVRYLLEGVVRTAGEKTKAKAWLTDTSTGNELWSDEFELERESAADAQGRAGVAARVRGQVSGAAYDGEKRRVLALPVSVLNAEELTLRGATVSERDSDSLDALVEARSLYEKALRLDPNLIQALMSKTYALSRTLELDPHADWDRLLREYDETSRRLVAVADRDARAWNIRADALQKQWRWDAALEANARAETIDPHRLNTLGQRADILIAMGQPEEALAQVNRAFLLVPSPAADVTRYRVSPSVN